MHIRISIPAPIIALWWKYPIVRHHYSLALTRGTKRLRLQPSSFITAKEKNSRGLFEERVNFFFFLKKRKFTFFLFFSVSASPSWSVLALATQAFIIFFHLQLSYLRPNVSVVSTLSVRLLTD